MNTLRDIILAITAIMVTGLITVALMRGEPEEKCPRGQDCIATATDKYPSWGFEDLP